MSLRATLKCYASDTRRPGCGCLRASRALCFGILHVALSVVGVVVSPEILDLALFVETGYVCMLVVVSPAYKRCERCATRLLASFHPYR